MSNVKSFKLLAAASLISFATPLFADQTAADYQFAYRFNSAGQMTGEIKPDPDGNGVLRFNAVRTSYNELGLAERVEQGELSSWQGESVSPDDWTGFTVLATTEYTYDDWGRRETEKKLNSDGNDALTQYSYNGNGKIECVAVRMNPAVYDSLPTDACTLGAEGDFGPDRISKYEYWGVDRIHKEYRALGTDAQQLYKEYTYNENSMPQYVYDANRNKAEMRYDTSNRLTRWVFPEKSNGNSINEADYEEYTLDANGNRTHLRKRDGNTIVYTYDNLDRVTHKNLPTGHDDVFYGYDNLGLQLYSRFNSISGPGVTHQFDGFGQIKETTSNMGGNSRKLSYGYDKNGNRDSLTFPDNVTFDYGYDGLDRLVQITIGLTVLNSQTYDQLMRRGRMDRQGTSTEFDYDVVAGLETITHDLAELDDDFSIGLEYNPANQIIGKTLSNDNYHHSGNGKLLGTYVPNALNQYDSVGGKSFTYDSNGNLTHDGEFTYVFDPENRLTEVTKESDNNFKIELFYDPLGRLFKVDDNGTQTEFLYDGDALVAEYSTGNSIQNRFLHGAAVDEPLIWFKGSGTNLSDTFFLHTNHQGSVVAISNHQGVLQHVNTYDAWGIADGGVSGRFAYTGQIVIPGLDIYHYKSRVYAPKLGRFLQTDPIGYDDHMNLYAYVGNDPMGYRDPTGMCRSNNGNPSNDCDTEEDETEIIEVTGQRPDDSGSNVDWWIVGGLILGDFILGGPSGEGIVPAMAMIGSRQVVKQGINKGAQKAAEKLAKQMAKKIQKDLGPEAKRKFHDVKTKGAGDRTKQELIEDAMDAYKEAGQPIPGWLRNLGG